MSYYLCAEILLTFIFTHFFLSNYVSFKKINFVTLVSVFICFCFSFLTIIILPSDIASTFYRQCAANHNQTDPATNTTVAPGPVNASLANYNLNEIGDEGDKSIDELCSKPFDYVKPQVLQVVWNIIYWTNFILTCFLLRVLSSFSVSGQFFFKKKLREFFHNFYYELALYLVFGLSLFIYLIYALSINVTEFISVRALISSLNNIYSLINLTILLGIGLVKVPSIFFRKSSYQSKLNYYLFKIAKQRERLVLADCEFEDCLDEIKKVNDVLKNGPSDRKLSYCLREIIKQTPEDFQKNIDTRVIYTENTTCPTLSEEKLVKLNRKFKEVNNTKVRLEALIGELADKTIELEEVIRNEDEPSRKYVSYNNHYKSERYLTTLFKRFIFVPKVEWYYKVVVLKNFYYYLSYFLIVLSAFLFMSELFHSLNLKSLVPVHLVFELLDYFNLNLVLKVYIIALLLYISVTAYHTLFTLNLFGYFKLTSKQQTDEYSLIFCTRYICSLSPAIALNMFNLIGLDYQSENKIRPSYTTIMGRLIFLNRLNDFLYFLFPAILCLLSFFTFFNLTDKILHMLGYERFTVQDEITTALIEDGRSYLEKEKKQRLRHSKNNAPKPAPIRKVERDESQRDLLNSPSTNESTPQSTSIDIVVQDARQSDNSASKPTSKPNPVNKNLFDDV